MTCRLYNISADVRAVTKVTAETPYTTKSTVKPTKAVDIISPVFVFDYDSAILSKNYLYCEDFGRYYFINNISVDIGGRVNVQCNIDVLQTYSTGIRAATATVVRAASKGKPTLYTDNKLPVYPSTKRVSSIVKNETGSNFSADGGYCYVLNVIGGAPIINE